MRVNGPSLSCGPNGRFPAFLDGHLETSLEPVFWPSSSTRTKTTAAMWPDRARCRPGRPAHNRQRAGLAAARTCRYYRRLARSMPSTGTGASRHGRGFRYQPVPRGPVLGRLSGKRDGHGVLL